MMKYIKNFFLYILTSSVLLYVIANYVPQLGFSLQSEYSNSLVIYLFLGITFWIINGFIKKILGFVTLPISALTFGLFSLVLSFVLLYVFEQFVNYLDLGIVVKLGNVVQVFVLACIFSFVYFLIKKI